MFEKEFSVFFILFLLLNSTFAMAYTPVQENANSKNLMNDSTDNAINGLINNSNNFSEKTDGLTGLINNSNNFSENFSLEFQGIPVVVNVPQKTVFNCETIKMPEEEEQKLLDLLRDGFLGKQFGNEQPALTPEEREAFGPKLSDPVLKTDEQGRVVKVEPKNNQPMLPREFPEISVKAKAFSFGVVLDDTKRVGRCNELDAKKPLTMSGDELEESFKEEVEDAFGENALKDGFFAVKANVFKKWFKEELLEQEGDSPELEAFVVETIIEKFGENAVKKDDFSVTEDVFREWFEAVVMKVPQSIPCPVEGNALLLRNSGEGIIDDMRPLAEGIMDLGKGVGKFALGWTGLFEKEKDFTEYTQEDYDSLRKNLGLPEDADSDNPLSSKLAAATDDDQLTHFRRKISDQNNIINNYLRSDAGFIAKFSTNCNVSSSQCTISVYSLFDRYYNQWYSSIMVLSTFAPALLHRAGKLVTKLSYSGEVDLTFGAWPWSRPWRRMMEHVRTALYDPYGKFTYLAQKRGGRIYAAAEKYPEIGKIKNALLEPTHWTGGYLLTKGTSFRQWHGSEYAKFLEWLGKQPAKVKKTGLQFIQDIRGLSRAQASKYWIAKRNYLKTYEKYGYGSAEEIASRIKYGIDAGKAARGYDATVRLDIGEWAIQKDEFADLYHYYMKLKGQNVYVPIYRDPAQLNMMEAKFWKDGHFSGAWPSSETSFMPEVYENTGKNLNLYEIKPGQFVDKVAVEDIKKQPAMFAERVAKADNGHVLKADEDALAFFKENAGPKIPLYEHGGYVKHAELKPEDFAGKYLSRRMEMTAASEPWRNSEQMYHAMLQQGFAGRKYGSWLDKAFSEQDELVKNYFNPLGGMKETARMYGYWYLKRGGIPGVIDSPFSGYMRAEDFKTIKFPLGAEPIYNDAFVDFFAQEGADQGDVFRQILSYLPWDLVLNVATEKFGVASDTFKKLTGKGTRSTVENVVDFVNSPKVCNNCTLTVDKNTMHSKVKSDDMIAFTFTSSSPLDSDMLEYISDEKKQKEGTTLITFARHTNIAGDKVINLAEAQKKKETCADKVREIAQGVPVIGTLAGKIMDTESIGGTLAFGESLGYYVFGLSGGLFLTVFQQTVIAPKLQDCVDTEGGYYAQISAPPKKLDDVALNQKKIADLTEQSNVLKKQLALKSAEKAKVMTLPSAANAEKAGALELEIKSLEAQIDDIKQEITYIQEASKLKGKTTGQLSTEKVFDGVKDFQTKLSSLFGSSEGAMNSFKEEVDKFLKSNEVDNMVQANVRTQGTVDGREEGPILFDLWFKGEEYHDKWPTEGEKQIIGTDGTVLTKDYSKGSLTATATSGELVKIMDSEEAQYLVRMNKTNTAIPAEEINDRATRISLPNDEKLMFELRRTGEFIVQNPEVLACIQDGIMQQTGLPFNGNNLTDVFGNILNIKTDMGYVVHPSENGIYANGSPPKTVTGSDARAEVLGNRVTILKNSENKKVGKMLSVTFDYGEILYRPDTDELVMVLNRNKQALIHQTDVGGLRPTLTSDKNPLTGCDEPAIDLDALPIPGSELSEEKVSNFNQSLDSMGPFKVFETPTKRYILYSKLENGECVPYFKIIDKETGKTLYDGPIDPATLKQTPTGIEFDTMDGKHHTLDFGAQNGIPTISYNGQLPETLTMAQGKNGSFWYDPNTGMWYPENGHLLPLIEAFKNGKAYGVDPNGKVAATASSGWQNVVVKAGNDTPFNLPSLPEEPLYLFVFIALIVSGIMFARIRIEKRNSRNIK